MKLFIKNSLIFTIFLTTLLYLIDISLVNQLQKGKRYFFQGDWHDLGSHNSKILLIGNSRVCYHLNPFEIEKYTGKKTEVISQTGQYVHILWLKFKEYLKNNKKPEHIILQFDPFFLGECKDLYGFENFSTGFFMNRLDLSSLKLCKGYSVFYHFIPLYAIDKELLKNILFNKTLSDSDSYVSTRGFKKYYKPWEGNWDSTESISINHVHSNYIDSFFLYSKQNNIKLDAVFTPLSFPLYRKIKNIELLNLQIINLNKKYGTNVALHNYNNSYYNDKKYFYNHMHLNAEGVNFFMKNQFLKDSTINWNN